MIEVDGLLEHAREWGAGDARVIDSGTVVTAAWVRMKCQFGCGAYGTSRCCPPNTPTPQQMREVIDGYQRAILVHCKGNASPGAIISRLEREAFLGGYYKALGLGAGPCRVCEKCKRSRCDHPEEARPSMEACGIDVYATVRANGFPIEVLKDRTCEKNFYSLLLLD